MPIHTENIIYDLSMSNDSVCDVIILLSLNILSIFSSWSLPRLTISWFMRYLPHRRQRKLPLEVPRGGKRNQKQTLMVGAKRCHL